MNVCEHAYILEVNHTHAQFTSEVYLIFYFFKTTDDTVLNVLLFFSIGTEKWKNDPFALALTERLEKKKTTGYVKGLCEDESSESFSETDEEGKKKTSVGNNESDVESADEGELEEISGCSRNPFALLADN